jgi:hypothetical protein
MNTVEGSLDIIWENKAQLTATPRYMLLFARYRNFKSGAQPSKKIVGKDALEAYLVAIGFEPRDAKEWARQVHEKQEVSIPHVMMPEDQMAVYEQQSARS